MAALNQRANLLCYIALHREPRKGGPTDGTESKSVAFSI